MRAVSQARSGCRSAEVAVQQRGDEGYERRELKPYHPHKPRIESSLEALESSVDAFESSVDVIESATHLGAQIANVGADLADRRRMLLAAAFQISNTLFESSHSRASFPGRHGPDSTSSSRARCVPRP